MEIISKIFIGQGRSKFNEISHLKKSWQMETVAQVNIIPLNTKSCCNTAGKAASVISKNIEPELINY